MGRLLLIRFVLVLTVAGLLEAGERPLAPEPATAESPGTISRPAPPRQAALAAENSKTGSLYHRLEQKGLDRGPLRSLSGAASHPERCPCPDGRFAPAGASVSASRALTARQPFHPRI